MPTKRTVVTISDMGKRWLKSYTKRHNIIVAEAIRRGIACLKASHSSHSYLKLVNDTKGIWIKGDGLKFQGQLRSECEA